MLVAHANGAIFVEIRTYGQTRIRTCKNSLDVWPFFCFQPKPHEVVQGLCQPCPVCHGQDRDCRCKSLGRLKRGVFFLCNYLSPITPSFSQLLRDFCCYIFSFFSSSGGRRSKALRNWPHLLPPFVQMLQNSWEKQSSLRPLPSDPS